jgi:ADP-L-glycero-D-manno-heptose 6-epimerase
MRGSLKLKNNFRHPIEMPPKIREHYQYFTQANVERLRGAGYNASFTSLEEGVRRYVTSFLNQPDRYR